jgi:hypothetical protein
MNTPTKTPEDVAQLKREWLSQPSYDIECAEGFDAYYDELLAFRLAQDRLWAIARATRIGSHAHEARVLACSAELAQYLAGLEKRVTQIERIAPK